MSLIELREVSKTYRIGDIEQTILSDINFQLSAGERVAIMGASGSGKSTLMNILGLLDRPTSGEYLLKGKQTSTLTDNECAALRNHTIGFVFQAFFLLPRLTLLQNVALPLRYRRTENIDKEQQALILLERVGLAHLSHHKPNQLSGGQQQRAAIARALISTPDVILADEPTGALDSQTGQMIMDLFIELNQKEKVTIVIITHDEKIAKQCQRVLHLQDGKITQH